MLTEDDDATRPARAIPPTIATPTAVPIDFDATVVPQRKASDDISGGAVAHRLVMSVQLALSEGYRLKEYRIDKVLGQGGFGITYLATDVNLNTRVAIKEYLPEHLAHRTTKGYVAPKADVAGQDYLLRLEQYLKGLDHYLTEARTLATFNHPNIVRVARFFEANKTAYMVMEYERGESLKAWWPSRAALNEADLLHLVRPLLDGLALVHKLGFLHRDIKPDNIYVRDTDGSLVLLDFGSARHNSQGTMDESISLTPGYGPVEQYMHGDQGPWTDIYALGATLYWMIGGGKPVEATERIRAVDPLKPALAVGKGRYSESFLSAIDWALMPQAKDRPLSIDPFRRALFAADPASLNLQDVLAGGSREVSVRETWKSVLTSRTRLQEKLTWLVANIWQFASWPLAVKMSLLMALTALTPMVMTAFYNYKGSVERIEASELNNLEQLAGSVAGRVSQLIGDCRGLTLFLASDSQFSAFLQQPDEVVRQSVTAKLVALTQSNPDIDVVTLLDVKGTAMASNNDTVTGRNFGFRQYFQEAIRGKSYVTGVIVGATAGGTGTYFAAPVLNVVGKPVGVITLRVKAAAIAKLIENSRGTSARMALMIDGDGVLIHHSDPALLYRSLVPLHPEKLNEIIADQRFRRNRIDSVNLPDLAARMLGAVRPDTVGYQSHSTGQSDIAGIAPVSGHNWVVAVTEPREFFEKPLNQLFLNVMLSVALVGLAFIALAIRIARSMVRPIADLTAAAQSLTVGDYTNANVRVTGADELGRFARVFNIMIDVLRQREREVFRLRNDSPPPHRAPTN